VFLRVGYLVTIIEYLLMIKRRTILALISFVLITGRALVNIIIGFIFSLDIENMKYGMFVGYFDIFMVFASWLIAVYVLILEFKNGIKWYNYLLILPGLTFGSIFLIFIYAAMFN